MGAFVGVPVVGAFVGDLEVGAIVGDLEVGAVVGDNVASLFTSVVIGTAIATANRIREKIEAP